MIPRPSLRLPIWGALAIIMVAYLVRAFVLRDGDLRPDLPMDVVVALIVVAGAAGVAWLRYTNDQGRAADEATRPSEHSEDDSSDSD